MARPTKLTPDTQQDIIDALTAGNYFDAACEYAGITERSGYNWLARGRAELERRENPRVREDTEQWNNEEPFVQFFQAVSRASARVEVRTIAKIQNAGDTDWRALAWFMEHRYPDKWGKQRTEITGANGGAIQSAQVTIEANNTHDAANILSELASLGAIPSKPRATDNNAETE